MIPAHVHHPLDVPRNRSNLYALTALIVLPCLWWYPLLAGQLPNFMDTITHGYPIRMAAARQLAEGTLPLWLPNQFSGIPLAANPQIAVWYPPQILFYLLPGAFTFGLVAVLHYIIGGWGAYYYLRRLTGSVSAGLFAGLTFTFSAMLISRIALMPHVFTVVWVPWMFLAVEKSLGERGFLPRRGALIIGVLFALQILAGAPQISYYTALMLPLYWIMRGVGRARHEKAPVLRRVTEVLSQGAVAAIIAALLAGIQLIPTAEFLQHSERSTISLSALRNQGLNDGFIWRSLVGFTGPEIEDTDSINAIGPGAILLGLFALLGHRSRRYAAPLLVIGVFGFLLSLGPLVPFWSAVLPLYESFHAPRRALVFWTIAGSLAAGMGVSLLETYWRARQLPQISWYTTLVILSVGTWWMLPRLERVFVSPAHLDADPKHARAIGADRFLTLDPTFAYAYDSRRPDFGPSLVSNVASLHDLHDVNGYDPLVPERYGYARRLASAGSGLFFPSHGAFFTDPNSPVLKLLNVQYLVGRWDLYDPGRIIPGTRIDHDQLSGSLNLVRADDRWPLFRYREPRPLAWPVERVLPARNSRDALHASMQSDPYRTAFVEEDLAMQADTPLPEVQAEHTNARTITITLDPPPTQDVFICISTNWMPGWTARSPTNDHLLTLPANGLIAGVLAPAGTATFHLTYHPTSFLRGTLATAAGALILILLWLRARRVSVTAGP